MLPQSAELSFKINPLKCTTSTLCTLFGHAVKYLAQGRNGNHYPTHKSYAELTYRCTYKQIYF